MLDTIERVGNKVPHPAIIFIILIAGVIVLSQILYIVGASVTYEVVEPPPVVGEQGYPPGSAVEVPFSAARLRLPAEDMDLHIEHETTAVKGLLTADGIRFMFTSPVANFNNFGVVGIILVAMLGVGLAEEAGLIGALIRLLVRVSPLRLITFIIVLIGILSSVATDAGYLVLIPLAAAAFHSMGRHPLAGLAAGFAGVGAAFGVNLLIAPIDGIMTEVANESIALVDPTRDDRRHGQLLLRGRLDLLPRDHHHDPDREGHRAAARPIHGWRRRRTDRRRARRGAPRPALRAVRLPRRPGARARADAAARSAAAQPGDRRDLRQLAVHDRDPGDHQPVLRRRRLCLRQGRRTRSRAASRRSTRW